MDINQVWMAVEAKKVAVLLLQQLSFHSFLALAFGFEFWFLEMLLLTLEERMLEGQALFFLKENLLPLHYGPFEKLKSHNRSRVRVYDWGMMQITRDLERQILAYRGLGHYVGMREENT